MTIERFRGEYFPFSNMYPLQNWIRADCGLEVPTSEHAYMSNRLKDGDLKIRVALARAADHDDRPYANGIAAKELAHSLIEMGAEEIIPDDFARIALMRRIVSQKVHQNPDVLALLLATGAQEIQEGNTWGDRFWGIFPPGSGEGQNHLGKTYMDIRAPYLTD